MIPLSFPLPPLSKGFFFVVKHFWFVLSALFKDSERHWTKAMRLLDQQWSCRGQATLKSLFIGELVLAIAQWNKWDCIQLSALYFHPCTRPAKMWRDLKCFPMRCIEYIDRFCLGWQPNSDLYNLLIQTCTISSEKCFLLSYVWY